MTVIEKEIQTKLTVLETIDQLVENGLKALKEFHSFTQEKIDFIARKWL